MRLSNPFRPPIPPPTGVVPDDRRVYAVGDIHGRDDLLALLLARIDGDCRVGGFAGRAILVFVGDYIDRGLGSRRVIDLLLGIDTSRYETIFLLGNHEAAMLEFLARPETGRFWFAIGGAETLFSYGVTPPHIDSDPSAFVAAAANLAAALPRAHLKFLEALRLNARIGDYLFVHAGVRPGRAPEAQSIEDMLEIREPFLRHRGRLPFIVVHGHTPGPEVHVDDRRIGLDTGAYATGRLSAIRLQGIERVVLST